ncbi:MAG TPA: DUF885 domain-containing protein [Thermoanaerobaculia bacterium]|nr:DUF885 domain-containing protein [Thermoanaerobaculia bacterium]
MRPAAVRRALLAGLLVTVLSGAATAAAPPVPAWVAQSNEHAKVLLEVAARFNPEFAGRTGVEGVDADVVDLKPQLFERAQKAQREALEKLKAIDAAEKDPLVKRDLAILIEAAEQGIEGGELNRKYFLPYFNVPQVVFLGIQSVLDDQVAPARRASALVRLRRYTGLEPGYRPITELAIERTRERLGDRTLLGPSRAQVETDLRNAPFVVEGAAKLFQRFGIEAAEPLARLRKDVDAYSAFVKSDVLPRCRTDFRLPPDFYAFQLRQYGVSVPPAELAARARASFVEIRNEMKAIAPLVAKEKGFADPDYRAVLRELKKSQIEGDAILAHYKARLGDLEAIVKREGVVTLPSRPARIRIGTDAENAVQPAPHMLPPRLIGNTGEEGEFVLPLSAPAAAPADGGAALARYDDFTFDAASWTLTVHEARPGHELQFTAMMENGVSNARAVYAFNSVNVEGWGLYCEAEMKPYMPLDGQLVSLQHRMMRAARAFLDPELQMRRMEPDAAKRFLMEEVVLSEPMARQEVERYTFRAPGQATSYYYGYVRWMQLRSEVETALGPKFDRRRFHDYALAQGLLPPDVLRKTVLEEFVPKEKGSVPAPQAAAALH